MRFAFGEFTLDARRFELSRGRTLVQLEPKVFDVLHHLVRQRGRVLSKQQILAAVWPDEHVIDAVVTRCVYEARKALGQTDVHGAPLATVRGRGYRFEAEVAVIEDAHDARAGATPFVGRAPVLMRLSSLLAEAQLGRGAIALLAGEPGIGKTRTAEELGTEARQTGCEVWTGRCDGTESAPSFWPFTEIVRACMRAVPPSRIEAALGASRAFLQVLLPEVAGHAPVSGALVLEGAPANAEYLLFDAVARLLHAACADRPVVLLLDDLQWADLPSLRLLAFLARDVGEHALLVIGTLRQSELSAGDPRKARLDQLSRASRVERITLEPLQQADVAAYVCRVFDRDLPELSRRLYERSEGYPFFMVEALRPHVLDPSSALHAVAQPLPDASRTIVRDRLLRLPERCRRLLDAAAVVGRAFDALLLAHVEDQVRPDAASVLDALAPALECCILRPPREAAGRLEFAHSFMREVVYADLTPPQRVRLHARVVDALERVSPAAHAELAFHVRHALPLVDVDKVVAYALLAGHAAAAQHAYDDAGSHYHHALTALDLRPSPAGLERRIETLLALGHAQRKAGELARAVTTFERAADLAASAFRHEDFARAALGLRDCQPLRASQASPVQALLQRALEALPEDEVVLRARVSSRLAIAGPPQLRREMSARAAQLASGIADPATLADVLNARLAAAQDPAEIGEKLTIAEELERLARRHAEPNWAWEARAATYEAYLRLGDVSKASAALQACAALADELQQAAMHREVARYRAQRALSEGRYAEAYAAMKRVRDLRAPLAADLADIQFSGQMLWLKRDLGELGAIGDALELFAARHRWAEATARAAMGTIYLEIGDAARARQCLDYYVRPEFENVPYGKDYVATCAHLAVLASALGDRGAAARILAMLSPYAHQNVVDRMLLSFGSASHHLGLLAQTLGHSHEARAHFEQAIAMNECIGAVPALARSELACASLLDDAQLDRERALVLRAKAMATADRIGMRGLTHRRADPIATADAVSRGGGR